MVHLRSLYVCTYVSTYIYHHHRQTLQVFPDTCGITWYLRHARMPPGIFRFFRTPQTFQGMHQFVKPYKSSMPLCCFLSSRMFGTWNDGEGFVVDGEQWLVEFFSLCTFQRFTVSEVFIIGLHSRCCCLESRGLQPYQLKWYLSLIGLDRYSLE